MVKADVRPSGLLGITKAGTLFYGLSGGDRNNIYVTNLNGKHATSSPVLATDSFINKNVGPSWSPDGDYLAYYSYRNPTVLVVREVKTGKEEVIVLPRGITSPFYAGPKWFPDKRSFLILTRDAQGPGFGFYRLDRDTGKTELLLQLNAGVSSYVLSPDGKSIYYAFQSADTAASFADGAPTGRLVRFDIAGGREIELKKDEWFITLALSPDGRELAYLKSIRDDALRDARESPSVVEVIPATGGPSREVFRAAEWLSGARYNTLAWTPDQRSLIFVQDDGEFWIAPVTGGTAEKFGISGGARGRLKSPSIHPDGTRIVFGAVEKDDNEVWTLEKFLPALNTSN
jgi:Tol biopolymer transport system component